MAKPVFQTPVRLEGAGHEALLVAADCELICVLQDATGPEAMTIKDAINLLREIVDDAADDTGCEGCVVVNANLIRRARGLIYG